MYFFTHLFISKVLYRNFKKEVNLSKLAFAYGNIKPDLPPACFKDRHTLDNYLFIVYDKANQLINNDLDIKEFSVKLGEVCHFICDFFCYYHLSDALHKKIFPHLGYELLLHLKLCKYRFKKKIQLPDIKAVPKKGIASIIFEMRRDYFSDPRSTKKDIDFALYTALRIFKRILYFQQYSLDFGGQPNLKTPFPAWSVWISVKAAFPLLFYLCSNIFTWHNLPKKFEFLHFCNSRLNNFHWSMPFSPFLMFFLIFLKFFKFNSAFFIFIWYNKKGFLI